MFLLPLIGGEGNGMHVDDSHATFTTSLGGKLAEHPTGEPSRALSTGRKGVKETKRCASIHTRTNGLRISKAKDPNNWRVYFWPLAPEVQETIFWRSLAFYTFQEKINNYIYKDFKRKDMLFP